MNKVLGVIWLTVLVGCGWSFTSVAAPREAAKNDGAMLKLQAMVKSLTAERDAAKTELEKLTSELAELKEDKSSALAAVDSLNSELAAQKASNGALRDRLDKTQTSLHETSEKHKEVSQAKAVLSNEFEALNAKQQATEQQLAICGEHNVKLSQAAHELLERYQDKGTLSSLMQDEPILQFQSVEMENLIQEYQDKVNDGKYKGQM